MRPSVLINVKDFARCILLGSLPINFPVSLGSCLISSDCPTWACQGWYIPSMFQAPFPFHPQAHSHLPPVCQISLLRQEVCLNFHTSWHNPVVFQCPLPHCQTLLPRQPDKSALPYFPLRAISLLFPVYHQRDNLYFPSVCFSWSVFLVFA